MAKLKARLEMVEAELKVRTDIMNVTSIVSEADKKGDIMSINQNVPACAVSGNNNGCRPNPNFANNSQYRSDADSKYTALHLAYQHRATSWSSVRISYAYSKSMNNVGEFSLPPSRVEAMYAPEMFGEAPNARMKVEAGR